MQRVKNIDYDDDDVYSDEDAYAEEEEEEEEEAGRYSAENKENFATLTPVVRAELDEAGIPATTKQIEAALWNYWWDVGDSVAYLKNSKTQQQPKQEAKKEKVKSKFDEAAEQSAIMADSKSPMPPMSAANWFKSTPWTNVPAQEIGLLVPAQRVRPEPRLLGGSSKLAKLAEERRGKAAAAQHSPEATATNSVSALDRLSKTKDTKENIIPVVTEESKKYPIRRKRSPTPPPRAPTPPPEEPREVVSNLRSSPTAFGVALSSKSSDSQGSKTIGLQELFGDAYSLNAFMGPSPDDTVIRAQQGSRGLNK